MSPSSWLSSRRTGWSLTATTPDGHQMIVIQTHRRLLLTTTASETGAFLRSRVCIWFRKTTVDACSFVSRSRWAYRDCIAAAHCWRHRSRCKRCQGYCKPSSHHEVWAHRHTEAASCYSRSGPWMEREPGTWCPDTCTICIPWGGWFPVLHGTHENWLECWTGLTELRRVTLEGFKEIVKSLKTTK